MYLMYKEFIDYNIVCTYGITDIVKKAIDKAGNLAKLCRTINVSRPTIRALRDNNKMKMRMSTLIKVEEFLQKDKDN